MAKEWTEPMAWDNEGSKPSDNLQTNGFQAGYKPPADIFNYFFNRSAACIKEIQIEMDKLPETLEEFNAWKNLIGAGTGKRAVLIGIPEDDIVGTANGDYAIKIGVQCGANGAYSIGAGHGSIANGDNSVALGYLAATYGKNAIALGYHAGVVEEAGAALGSYTVAKSAQTVVGKCNNSNVSDGANLEDQTTGSVFMVGNGYVAVTTNDDGTTNTTITGSNVLRCTAAGKTHGASSFSGTGADFAEFFEWFDGNPDNEDRRGRFVALQGDKIALANADDDYIGVISGAQAFIGNAASEDWQGRWLKDVFGERITKEVDIPEYTDKETGKVVPAHKATRFVENPNYNPDEKYISREFRKEWATVGMLGQVVVVDDGTCIVGGFCRPSKNGVGTAAESGYRVMKRIDENHIKVLVK